MRKDEANQTLARSVKLLIMTIRPSPRPGRSLPGGGAKYLQIGRKKYKTSDKRSRFASSIWTSAHVPASGGLRSAAQRWPEQADTDASVNAQQISPRTSSAAGCMAHLLLRHFLYGFAHQGSGAVRGQFQPGRQPPPRGESSNASNSVRSATSTRPPPDRPAAHPPSMNLFDQGCDHCASIKRFLDSRQIDPKWCSNRGNWPRGPRLGTSGLFGRDLAACAHEQGIRRRQDMLRRRFRKNGATRARFIIY